MREYLITCARISIACVPPKPLTPPPPPSAPHALVNR